MLCEYLQLENFKIDVVHDGASAIAFDLEAIDLVVLDVMLPAANGFDVLKRLRQRGTIPVIMLTARDSDVDKIVGFELGADDYVPKPVNPRELLARIRAVLRRAAPELSPPGAELIVGEIRLDTTSRNAWVSERRLELTTAEFDLLQHLLRNAGRIVSRAELSAAAFGRRNPAGVDRNVDTLVSKVRRKLDPTSAQEDRIKTIRNSGYLFALPAGGFDADQFDDAR